jgi:hypothetical protein
MIEQEEEGPGRDQKESWRDGHGAITWRTGTDLFSGGELRELERELIGIRNLRFMVEMAEYAVAPTTVGPGWKHKLIIKNYLRKKNRQALERQHRKEIEREQGRSAVTFTARDIELLAEDFPMAGNVAGRVAHALRTWCAPDLVPSVEERRRLIAASIINADQNARVKKERSS